MKLVVYMLALVFVTVLLFCPLVVQADDFAFCPSTSSGDWDTLANWKEGDACDDPAASNLPTDGDRVFITTGKTCFVDITTAEADRLVIEEDAILTIEASSKLTLDGDGGGSSVGGCIELDASGAELAFINNDHTLSMSHAAAAIVGNHESAAITIASDQTLTTQVAIRGIMEISGLGTFVNDATVGANTAGTLYVHTQFLGDTASATWNVSSSSSAVLRIDITNTSTIDLDGDFVIGGGATLDLDDSLTTDGIVSATNGTIDVASGASTTFTP